MKTADRLLFSVIICAALHFLVDAVCCCSMMLLSPAVPYRQVVGIFLCYNVLAFVSQPFTGMCVDRLRHRHWLLLLSCVLLAFGVLSEALALGCGQVSPVVAYGVPFLLGVGNSLFHVWGGKEVAISARNDLRALGVFVSTGAFGLSVGTLCCSWPLLLVLLLLVALLSMGYLHVGQVVSSAGAASPSVRLRGVVVVLAVLAVALLVLFRSYVGERLTTGVHRSQWLILMLGLTAMAGKMAGGWVALRLGVVRALVLLLLAFAFCFWWRDQSVVVMLAGLFFINCTMPVTLYWANALLPGREGLAFGLLAAVLVPGYLLAIL